MPRRDSTSRTSPAPLGDERFFVLDLDRVCVNRRLWASPLANDDAWSSVETEGGRVKAGFDIPLRPSRASRRSVTPSPRVDLARLCIDKFSMCINAGDILSRGETPSPRNVCS